MRCFLGVHNWGYSAGATAGPRQWRGCARCDRREVSAYDGMSISWERTALSFGEFIDRELGAAR